MTIDGAQTGERGRGIGRCDRRSHLGKKRRGGDGLPIEPGRAAEVKLTERTTV